MLSVIQNLSKKIQTIKAELQEDIQAVFDRDPAARNTLEVLLTYPGVRISTTGCSKELLGLCDVPRAWRMRNALVPSGLLQESQLFLQFLGLARTR